MAKAEVDYTEVYRDDAGLWRWRRKAANPHTIASSGESFDSRFNAERAALRVFPPIPPAEIPLWVFAALMLAFLAGVAMGWVWGRTSHHPQTRPVVRTTTTVQEGISPETKTSLIPSVSEQSPTTSTTSTTGTLARTS